MRAFNKGPLEAGNLQMIRMKSSYGGSSTVETGLLFVNDCFAMLGCDLLGEGL